MATVLIALADEAHLHHTAARTWFAARARLFATCPITQGTLLRMLLNANGKHSVAGVVATMRGFIEHPRHRFWPDAIDYLQADWKGVLAHRQVTAIWRRWRAATAVVWQPSTRAWPRCIRT
ncbi:hypothetical protein [Thermomonas carbonis]|uniref:hypothetical protein n=1 Tax=Thermomonas carbonis TaxID=1463158 RepID=UPI00199A8453|nr:hypothetical protein [Thermomonas carbonis]GHC02651.1 hypothetical protein GCM10010080_15650 [Thermomonas carbonis]